VADAVPRQVVELAAHGGDHAFVSVADDLLAGERHRPLLV
jgi:hypothetical protein